MRAGLLKQCCAYLTWSTPGSAARVLGAGAGPGAAGSGGRRTSDSVPPMADSSFDIVSKVDHQEVDNALNQAAKEISQRFDFKNVGASIKWSGETVRMEANSEERVKAILDVFETKLIKRGISLKSLKKGDPTLSGKEYYLVCEIEQGISSENA